MLNICDLPIEMWVLLINIKMFHPTQRCYNLPWIFLVASFERLVEWFNSHERLNISIYVLIKDLGYLIITY